MKKSRFKELWDKASNRYMAQDEVDAANRELLAIQSQYWKRKDEEFETFLCEQHRRQQEDLNLV